MKVTKNMTDVQEAEIILLKHYSFESWEISTPKSTIPTGSCFELNTLSHSVFIRVNFELEHLQVTFQEVLGGKGISHCASTRPQNSL